MARAASPLRAEEITTRNAAELLLGGPDAIGGVGDVYLANDRIELVVDHPSRRHAKLNHGGTIVDLGLRDRRDEDQFARLIPLVNLSQRVLLGYDAIRTEVDGELQRARVVVTSSGMSSIPRGGLASRALDPLVPDPERLRDVRVETVYEVRPGEPFVRITTRFSNKGDEAAPVFAYGDLWMRGGRGLRAFMGHATAPELARGFQHRSFSRADVLGSIDAMAPFSHVVAAGLPAFPPIAYAFYSPERNAAGLSFFGLTGRHVSVALAFRADPGWRELSPLRLLRVLRGELSAGEVWEIERRLLVTGRADVGSATDLLLPALGVDAAESGLAGRALPAEVDTIVHVQTAAGHAVTQLRSESGAYAASLPPGVYRLTLRAAHRSAVSYDVEVRPGTTTRLEDVFWPDPGALRLSPAFADGGPGRILVRGRDGTSTPVFGAELLDFRIDGKRVSSATETSAVHFVGNARDPLEIPLPPGRYTLVASRGLEYDAEQREVEIREAGERVTLAPFELARIASLPGYVSADLHVHAQASDDTGATNESQLRAFVAAGLELLVASDHDHVADYGPALASLGLAGRIRVVPGVEVTSSAPSHAAPFTIAHHNAWPVSFEPTAHRRGAPPSQELLVGELYSRLRGEYRVGVVQLNHPRPKRPGEPDPGTFHSHQGAAGHAVDTSLPLAASEHAALLAQAPDGTRAIDFDAIEVMNGASWLQYLQVRDDFHWLLRQGERRTATANSDSHGPDELAGMPRNYVRLPSVRRDLRGFDSALRAGRSFGSNGPLLVQFSANGAESGDLVTAADGRVFVEYDVRSAPWVPVDEVRLLVNGEVVRVSREGAERHTLRLSRDAFLTLEAGAPLHVEPETWVATHRGLYTDALAPGFVPAAFSNPIYVDVDGDGRWTPPGLPPPPWSGGAWRPTLAVVVVLLAGGLWRRRRRAGSLVDTPVSH